MGDIKLKKDGFLSEDKYIIPLKVAILAAFRIIRLASNYWLAFFCGRFTMGEAGRTQGL
ncbi:hypothetical protein M3625_18560 [Paenibacillus sp. MER 78]|nr:hypothetical protein [Paenibacillus sp. MER 78]